MPRSLEDGHIEGAARRRKRRPISALYMQAEYSYKESVEQATDNFRQQEKWILGKMLQGKKVTATDISSYNRALSNKNSVESTYNRAKELWGNMREPNKESCRQKGYNFDKLEPPASGMKLGAGQELAKMDQARRALPWYVKSASFVGGAFLSFVGFFAKGLGFDAPYSMGIGLLYNAGAISGHTMVEQAVNSGVGLRAGLASSVIEAAVPKPLTVRAEITPAPAKGLSPTSDKSPAEAAIVASQQQTATHQDRLNSSSDKTSAPPGPDNDDNGSFFGPGAYHHK